MTTKHPTRAPGRALKPKAAATRGDKRAPAQTYAVITGDIIASSAYSPVDLQRVMTRLRDAGKRFAQAYPGSIRGHLDVFSGDAWQVLLADWPKAFRFALFMRAALKAGESTPADTRISIGIGSIDEAALNLARISESTGPAFEFSGRALKALRKPFLMTCAIPETSSAPIHGRLLDASLRLLDEIVCRWTPKQARSISLALLGQNQYRAALKLRISQPAVSYSLGGAGWRGMEQYVLALENNIKNLFSK